ncbi:MAG: tetratricopeptide repeat protein, partial [Caulobacterales bacterium]
MNRAQRRLARKRGGAAPVATSPAARELFAQAVAHHRAGRQAEAETLYRRVLAADPRNADALHGLGVVAFQTGRYQSAVDLIGQAISIDAAPAIYHSNLGAALKLQGKLDEAVARYRKAISLDPSYADAHYNLGVLYQQQEQFEAAIASYEQALAAKPGYAAAHNNLGNVFKVQGRLAKAAACFERALMLAPDDGEILNNLGATLMAQGELEGAAARFEQALAGRPDDAKIRSNLLMSLNYTDRSAADEIFAAHRRFGEIHERELPPPAPHLNDRDPKRRLRVGYVSPDFKEHATAWFLSPLLASHDHAAVEVFCYAEVANPDRRTAQLQGMADHWRSSVGLSDQALAERIRADRIDILVDVAGHTAGNRLTMFALKPAPVQVTWLGYPNTTGLAAMDYKLVDAITDPQGGAAVWSTETLFRLDDGFICYGASSDDPAPAPPPCLAAGMV